jgi:UDP-N-acetylglucosamine 1-carboxyvinyltransferase
MGASVYGAGTRVIYIKGVKKLHGAEFSCIPDRIEAGTFLCAAAATGGSIALKGVIKNHIEVLTEILEGMGGEIRRTGDVIRFSATRRLRAFSFETAPYPAFPTDLQSQMCALACVCRGESRIRETVFENRMHHLEKLAEAGGEIARVGDTVLIRGRRRLKPMDYTAHDLRGGAAYIIAALAAEGRSTVSGTHFIDRGYEDPEGKFSALGADIIRV